MFQLIYVRATDGNDKKLEMVEGFIIYHLKNIILYTLNSQSSEYKTSLISTLFKTYSGTNGHFIF